MGGGQAKHNIEQVGAMAVVECEARIVYSDAVFKLRHAVLSRTAARIVVLDLSEWTWEAGGWECSHSCSDGPTHTIFG